MAEIYLACRLNIGYVRSRKEGLLAWYGGQVMRTKPQRQPLDEAMLSGVFIEMQDAMGHLIAQSVFADWPGQPVPDMGDQLCFVADHGAMKDQNVVGRVRRRQFDVQRDESGSTAVWVRLLLDEIPQPLARKTPRVPVHAGLRVSAN